MFDFKLQKDALGKEIFKIACKKIGLTEEMDYFGLRFVNKQDGEVGTACCACLHFVVTLKNR